MEELRQKLEAFRIQVRACRNVARTTLQLANDVERAIDDYLDKDAEPREAERNDEHYRRALAGVGGL